MECFKNIIGISRTECECLASAIPPEDQESKSGIYLDEVEGGLKISAIAKIDCRDFLEKAKDARKRAIDLFIEQIIGVYSSAPYRRRYRQFKSRIGKVNSLRPLNTKTYAGLRLRSNLIRGAELTVTKIGLILMSEQDVTVQVYKSYRDDSSFMELVTEYSDIPTIANVTSTYILPEPLVLPLYDDNLREIDYYFVYDTSEYGQPRDNQSSCSCGGMESILKTYLKSQGVTSDTVEGLVMASASNYAYGLFLEAEIDCGVKEMLCSLLTYDESNTIAHAIAYKAQELLIEDVLGSANINRFTMLSNERLWGKRNHFRKEFDDRVIWLSQVLPVEQISDCLHCNDNGYRKITIR